MPTGNPTDTPWLTAISMVRYDDKRKEIWAGTPQDFWRSLSNNSIVKSGLADRTFILQSNIDNNTLFEADGFCDGDSSLFKLHRTDGTGYWLCPKSSSTSLPWFIRVLEVGSTDKKKKSKSSKEDMLIAKVGKKNLDKLKGKSALTLHLIRDKSGTHYLEFQVAPEITTFFKELADETTEEKDRIRESNSWSPIKGEEPLRFFFVPSLTDNVNYKHLLSKLNLVDNFGGKLFDGNRMNIAFLRTVEGKGTIKLTTTISKEEMTDAIEMGALPFIRDFFHEYIKPYEQTFSLVMNV